MCELSLLHGGSSSQLRCFERLSGAVGIKGLGDVAWDAISDAQQSKHTMRNCSQEKDGGAKSIALGLGD